MKAEKILDAMELKLAELEGLGATLFGSITDYKDTDLRYVISSLKDELIIVREAFE